MVEDIPEGGLEQGESVKKFFRPSYAKYLVWYIIGFFGLFLYIIPGLVIFLIAELHRRSHRYFITNQRVIKEFKLLRRDIDQSTFDLITGVSINQSLIERMFGMGTVIVKTASGEVITFKDISSPNDVKNVIVSSKHKDKNKVQKVEVVGKEGGGKKYCPDCGDEISPSSKFCPSCGHKLTKEKKDKNIEKYILKGTIEEIKDDVKELDNPDYDKLIKLEKSNKNRKSLIDWLKEQKEDED
ncbi:MAG: hypothetical protein COS47_00605 [Candidatus Nealsonbacteria bacterium CG03_land_8_20_14_0_80_36_12]|uniref:Zinc-ribbon domain-containing protein n=1 Tax=Candidatus Nealsonbacteria bacterium CG03_land_8_20_14_0_80_36_12 TaxID=1974701 RepID=A0A2M7BYP7_9BACT|nr:MAG: hypothetical protein COS47_00605 [Candidatus Nealsonbacteria bacterium CG03_land_8_20_14_0_80_36_12]